MLLAGAIATPSDSLALWVKLCPCQINGRPPLEPQMWTYLETGSLQMGLVEMRLCWSRVGLVKRGKSRYRHIQTCKFTITPLYPNLWTWRQSWEWCIYKPRNAEVCHQTTRARGEAWNRSFLTVSEEPTLLVPWSWLLASRTDSKPFLLCKLPSEWTVLGELWANSFKEPVFFSSLAELENWMVANSSVSGSDRPSCGFRLFHLQVV